MMTEHGGLRSTSPVHVHVDDDAPVHVHVRKPILKKSSTDRAVEERLRGSRSQIASSFGGSNLRSSSGYPRRSTASSRIRSKSPAGGPWVPPPAKSTRGTKISWKGAAHTLEITPREEQPSSSMRVSDLDLDLDTDEEDKAIGHQRVYENKINSLMTEVGTLKNEVELQNTLRDVERKSDEIEASRHVMRSQEKELKNYQRELDSTETENKILRMSLGRLKEDSETTRTQTDVLSDERDLLMKKLVEVEMDGQTAMRQVQDMRDTLRRLREDKRISSSDSLALAKQKDALMSKLTDYEASNRTLRRLLRDQHEGQASSIRLSEQRDVLLRKLGETDDSNQRLRTEVVDKDRLITDLETQVRAQREENIALNNLQASLEQTKAHLQKQLRSKEADCNRMAVQIRGLESHVAQEKIEVDHLQELMGAAKEKAERDKEALKKATRVQKERASRSENAVDQLNSQLLEHEAKTAECQAQMDETRLRIERLLKEKSHVTVENSSLKNRITELESVVNEVRGSNRVQLDAVNTKLHDKNGEVTSLQLENERLQTNISTQQERLEQGDFDLVKTRSSLAECEHLLDKYKEQVNRTRKEANEVSFRLEEQHKETSRIQTEGDIELEKVRIRLQQRLQELEPLPELLKTTQLKYQDAQERLGIYEQRSGEHTKLITDLTAKVEQQTEEMSRLNGKLNYEQERSRTMDSRMESLDRKLKEFEDQNRDLLTSVTMKDEQIRQNNLRLEECTQEKASVSRQLENSLIDARKRDEDHRERTAAKERTMQSRVMDLESQLSQVRAENCRIKREKEESERKFNSRLYDLKDRLEQSHSTNRSMQNYVQFLKNSYSNVFGDTSMAGASPMHGHVTLSME